MLCLNQCVEMCGLGREEVEIIAEHEKVPDMVAAQIGCQLLGSEAGVRELSCILLDRLEQARMRGDAAHAQHVYRTYSRFRRIHGLRA